MATKPLARAFANQTEHHGIQMTICGQWLDLAAYYQGSDGNAWCYNWAAGCSWSNCGDYQEFRRTFAQRHRGNLIPD